MPDLLQNVTDRIRRLTMSYDEYVEWADEDVHAEWVDGEVIVHTPPKEVHQRIVGFVYELLSQFARLQQLGTVYFAPFEVTLWEDGPARAPDVFFVSSRHAGQSNSNGSVAALSLVVEVISPGTVLIDRNDKLREYEEAGVREYWIIDSRPGYQRADFYRLDDEGRYVLFATEDDDVVESTVLPGFWLHPGWLWQEQLPNPLLLLADIVDADTLVQVIRGERTTAAMNDDRQLSQPEPPRLLGNGNGKSAEPRSEENGHHAPDDSDAESIEEPATDD